MSAAVAAEASHFSSKSGRAITLRAVRADDSPAISTMIGSLSPRTLSLRYMLPQVTLSAEAAHREAERITCADPRRLVYVAIAEEGAVPRIIAIAELAHDIADPALAEGAIVVADSFQQDGIGRAMVSQLIAAAPTRGIVRVRAIVLAHNRAIRKLIAGLGRPYTTRFAGGEIIYEIG